MLLLLLCFNYSDGIYKTRGIRKAPDRSYMWLRSWNTFHLWFPFRIRCRIHKCIGQRKMAERYCRYYKVIWLNHYISLISACTCCFNVIILENFKRYKKTEKDVCYWVDVQFTTDESQIKYFLLKLNWFICLSEDIKGLSFISMGLNVL